MLVDQVSVNADPGGKSHWKNGSMHGAEPGVDRAEGDQQKSRPTNQFSSRGFLSAAVTRTRRKCNRTVTVTTCAVQKWMD